VLFDLAVRRVPAPPKSRDLADQNWANALACSVFPTPVVPRTGMTPPGRSKPPFNGLLLTTAGAPRP
jgi:hypothetical protein